MMALFDFKARDRLAFSVGRQAVKLARAAVRAVAVDEFASFDRPLSADHCRLQTSAAFLTLLGHERQRCEMITQVLLKAKETRLRRLGCLSNGLLPANGQHEPRRPLLGSFREKSAVVTVDRLILYRAQLRSWHAPFNTLQGRTHRTTETRRNWEGPGRAGVLGLSA